jgi:hypothetical protein
MRLLGELAEQDEELAKAREGNWREIDVTGLNAREFLWFVREKGQPTLRAVDRKIFREEAVTWCFMRALHRAKLIRTKRNGRKHLVVYIREQV